MTEYIKLIGSNKKARFNYQIDAEYEAGIVLVGSEVKSMREGRVSFQDSYADIRNGELFLRQLHISPY
jgi:SsrA-binding protein